MVRSCRYSTPLWLFEKNNRSDSGYPPPKASIFQQKSSYKFSCSKALPIRAFPCQVWKVWGVERGEWTLSLPVNITPLVLLPPRDLTLELMGSFAFSQKRDDFPTITLHPIHEEAGTSGGIRSQPQETLTGAAQSMPGNQVVRSHGRKLAWSPGAV